MEHAESWGKCPEAYIISNIHTVTSLLSKLSTQESDENSAADGREQLPSSRVLTGNACAGRKTLERLLPGVNISTGHNPPFDGSSGHQRKRRIKERQRRTQGQLMQAPAEEFPQQRWALCQAESVKLLQRVNSAERRIQQGLICRLRKR
jgi:hypothetical protein